MSSITCQISVSLDGFVAGPDQSEKEPLGRGGERLHDWVVATASWRAKHGLEGGLDNVDSEVNAEAIAGNGAYVMGRNMFTAGRGAWDESWKGWWGDDPPFHTPVFVLTHHAREPLEMEGGTTYHFVTDGIASAVEQARAAAGDRNVAIAGGASTIRQVLAAGLLDELWLHVVPIFLGAGERLLEDVGDPKFEPVDVRHSPAAVHIRYRIGGDPQPVGA